MCFCMKTCLCDELNYLMQIEDLSQQAQMAAAEKFKTPENPAGLGGEVSSTVSQPIPEESEDEGEVIFFFYV